MRYDAPSPQLFRNFLLKLRIKVGGVSERVKAGNPSAVILLAGRAALWGLPSGKSNPFSYYPWFSLDPLIPVGGFAISLKHSVLADAVIIAERGQRPSRSSGHKPTEPPSTFVTA